MVNRIISTSGLQVLDPAVCELNIKHITLWDGIYLLHQIPKEDGFLTKWVVHQPLRKEDHSLWEVVLRKPGDHPLLLHVRTAGDVNDQVSQVLPVSTHKILIIYPLYNLMMLGEKHFGTDFQIPIPPSPPTTDCNRQAGKFAQGQSGKPPKILHLRILKPIWYVISAFCYRSIKWNPIVLHWQSGSFQYCYCIKRFSPSHRKTHTHE